ncbi:MAG: DNA-binding protein [Bacillota bacterium]|nr:DNA-binding protein [Bacillota bacterium]
MNVNKIKLEKSSEKRTYTVDEICSLLNIGRTSAYALVREGHFKVVRIGNAIRISRKSFDEWLDRQSC